jgi:hypothetical protein
MKNNDEDESRAAIELLKAASDKVKLPVDDARIQMDEADYFQFHPVRLSG